jgi:hypothetical protein
LPPKDQRALMAATAAAGRKAGPGVQATRDLWYHADDIGRRVSDGYDWFVDRVKELSAAAPRPSRRWKRTAAGDPCNHRGI